MTKITASQVNELRKKTGSGMMDCKNALVEAEGDLQAAIDILRKKGQKVAAKRQDRETSEGLVFANTTSDNKKGILVLLGCETDFVAKNNDYQQLTQSFVDIALANLPADLASFKALKYDDNLTVEEKITEQIGVIGEKLDLNYAVIDADFVLAYNHPGNQVATVVGFNKDENTVGDAAKQVALQVASMAPIAVDKDSIPQDVVDKELEIGKELAIQEGKPAEMAEKISHGRLNKFFKENTLLNQVLFSDGKRTVKDYLKDFDKDLTVTDFKRISLN